MRKQILSLLILTLCSSVQTAEPKLKKDEAIVLYEEGLALAREGEIHASRDKLKRALLLDPNNKEIQILLESVLRVSPGPPIVLTPEVLSKEYYRQGLDSYINGNHRKAKQLFRQSLKADPGNKEAQRGLERLAIEGKKKKLAEQGAEPDAGTGRKLTP
jgi:tetratricopeptide (TPR) repeat protein